MPIGMLIVRRAIEEEGRKLWMAPAPIVAKNVKLQLVQDRCPSPSGGLAQYRVGPQLFENGLHRGQAESVPQHEFEKLAVRADRQSEGPTATAVEHQASNHIVV